MKLDAQEGCVHQNKINLILVRNTDASYRILITDTWQSIPSAYARITAQASQIKIVALFKPNIQAFWTKVSGSMSGWVPTTVTKVNIVWIIWGHTGSEEVQSSDMLFYYLPYLTSYTRWARFASEFRNVWKFDEKVNELVMSWSQWTTL